MLFSTLYWFGMTAVGIGGAILLARGSGKSRLLGLASVVFVAGAVVDVCLRP